MDRIWEALIALAIVAVIGMVGFCLYDEMANPCVSGHFETDQMPDTWMYLDYGNGISTPMLIPGGVQQVYVCDERER